jgi:hypothetical protein
LFIITNIIFFLINFGNHDEADGGGREFDEIPPYPRTDEESVIGTVQGDDLFIEAIIEQDVKKPAGGHDELPLAIMGMSSTVDTTGDIIHVIYPFAIEGDVFQAFDNGDIAGGVMNLAEGQDGAVVDGGGQR